jgi:hypothetical protein
MRKNSGVTLSTTISKPTRRTLWIGKGPSGACCSTEADCKDACNSDGKYLDVNCRRGQARDNSLGLRGIYRYIFCRCISIGVIC